MSEHKAKIKWINNTDSMDYTKYNRDHEWYFEDGAVVKASAAPDFLGDKSLIDPEEAFVASISSFHMLTFLAICSKKKFFVQEYMDEPVGFLEKDDDGKMSINRVILKPDIKFLSAEKTPSPEELDKIHQRSHTVL
ncbi:MAG: OsmC family protein [Thermodesulfobacteriota bacterium]